MRDDALRARLDKAAEWDGILPLGVARVDLRALLAAYDALLAERDYYLERSDHWCMETALANRRLLTERDQAAPVLAAVEQWDDDHGGDHDCTACQTFQPIIATWRAAREG